jgi:hypothetical protein
MNWKALCIIVKETNAALDGTTYQQKLTQAEIERARRAFSKLPSKVSSNTYGLLSMDTSTVKEVNLLTGLSYVDSNTKKDVWPSCLQVILTLQAEQSSFTMNWGDFDSIIVIWPGYQFGWGYFDPAICYGCTYATVPGGWNTEEYDGEALLHEWLHGSCNFFKKYDWLIPEADADGGGTYNYSKTGNSWNAYYIDLMNGNVKDQKPPYTFAGGITPDIWKMGTPTNPGKLIGYKANSPDRFINTWRTKKAIGTPYIQNKMVHVWNNGEIQDYVGSGGSFSIMQSFGGKNAWLIPPDFWSKYILSGGSDVLGYPTSDVHVWGKGYVQDFETHDKWHSGILRRSDSYTLYLVKGNIWIAYTATEGNGATSYLGYPVEEEWTWTSPENHKNYFVQSFEGGYCWATTEAPWKCGNDKQWRQKSIPKNR